MRDHLEMRVRLSDGHVMLCGFGSLDPIGLDGIERLIRDLQRARRRILAEQKKAQEKVA